MGALPPTGAQRLTGSAAELHGRPLEPSPGRRVEVLEVTAPALVLGSTQPDGIVDRRAARAAGVEVARRRSGGGAVFVAPGEGMWIDVTIARDDPMWDDDVGRAFHWLGRAWVTAVRSFGVNAEVHTGPLVETPWSRAVCFAGLGPGEVTVEARKLVGISQRRTRDGARFQCYMPRSWEPEPLLDLLVLDAEERARARAELLDAASGLDVPTDAIVTALVAALPA